MSLTGAERNERYLENNNKERINLVVDSLSKSLKEKYGFTHNEIYEAGLAYLIALKDGLQQSENIS